MAHNPFVADPTLNRLNHLSRWQGFPTIKPESVAQHSYWVSYWTAVLMAEILSENTSHAVRSNLTGQALQLAIFHDVDEAITGDITHPVKYNDLNGETLRACLKEYATAAVKQKWPGDPGVSYSSIPYNQLAREYIISDSRTHVTLRTIIKVADYLSMFNYAVHETELGNQIMGGEMLFGIERLIEHAIHICRESLKQYNREYNIGALNTEVFTTILTQVKDVTNKHRFNQQ